jgi:ATP-dependent DNA helicase RecG
MIPKVGTSFKGMRPPLLHPLFAPITSLSGVGPKQDRLFSCLLGRDETPRLVDLLLHLPASVIDRRARPQIRDAVCCTALQKRP